MPDTDALLLCSLLPFIATLICGRLIYKLNGRATSATPYALFANLFALAAIQTAGYWTATVSAQAAPYFADAYLIGAYFFFAHLVLFALYLSGRNYKYKYLLYGPPILLTALHWSGLMIESYRWEQHSLMHNDGPAAVAFDAFALISLIACIAILCVNSRSAGDRITKSRNRIMIYSFIPLVIMFGVLALLSATDYAVSATLVSPLTIIYSSLMYYYISGHEVVDCSSGPGYFLGRLKLAWLLLKTGTGNADLKAFKKALDAQIIAESLARNNYNIPTVAREMQIHHTTLRSKIKENSQLNALYLHRTVDSSTKNGQRSMGK